MADSIVCYNVTDFVVGLGMACDLRSERRSLFQYINSEKYVKEHTETISNPGGTSDCKKCTTLAESATTIAGSMEISMDIASVIKLTGTGSLSMDCAESASSETFCFNINQTLHTERLHIGGLGEDDLIRDIGVTPTHFVSSITYGKLLVGSMSLTAKDKSKDMKVKGSLEAQLAKVPVGGKVKIEVDNNETMRRSNFHAQCQAVGGELPGVFHNIEEFSSYMSRWTQSEVSGLVSYVLEPLTAINGIPRFSGMTLLSKFDNDVLKQHIVNMQDLASMVNRYSRLVDDEEADVLIDFYDEVVRKQREAYEMITTSQLDPETINVMREYSRQRYRRIKPSGAAAYAIILLTMDKPEPAPPAEEPAPPAEEPAPPAEEPAPPAEEPAPPEEDMGMLTEADYQREASKKDDAQMRAFFIQVAGEMGYKLVDGGDLSGMVPYYSGVKATQTLANLRNELKQKSNDASPWVLPK